MQDFLLSESRITRITRIARILRGFLYESGMLYRCCFPESTSNARKSTSSVRVALAGIRRECESDYVRYSIDISHLRREDLKRKVCVSVYCVQCICVLFFLATAHNIPPVPIPFFAPAEQYVYRKMCTKCPHSSGVLCIYAPFVFVCVYSQNRCRHPANPQIL